MVAAEDILQEYPGVGDHESYERVQWLMGDVVPC